MGFKMSECIPAPKVRHFMGGGLKVKNQTPPIKEKKVFEGDIERDN